MDGSDESIVDPPVSDSLWERVQAIRAERATPETRPTRERVYVPPLFCHGCGAALRRHASSGKRRMTHSATAYGAWLDASGRRTSFRAEIYEWQISVLFATARVDEAARLGDPGSRTVPRPSVSDRPGSGGHARWNSSRPSATAAAVHGCPGETNATSPEPISIVTSPTHSSTRPSST